MSKEPIRKYFDIGPAAIATANVYTGGSTGWAAGIVDPASGPALLATLWPTGLSQSDDDQGRVGQSINVETFDVRVKITPDNTAGGHGHLRMIIAADEECDGVAPSYPELLGPTASTIASGLVMSFLQPGYFGRFKIIEDKHWQWNNLNSGAYQSPEYRPDLYHESHHDMKSHRVMWDASNLSTITAARKGHIFIWFFFENTTTAVGGIIAATTTNPPGIQLTTRIRYRDT